MTRRILLTAILAFLFALTAEASDAYRLEKAAAPPDELATAIRETLAAEGWRVVGPDGPLCEMWIRKAVPAKSGAGQELGIAFSELTEGTLVGAVRFLHETSDYRRVKVKPGVYTLRYMLNPSDGNHLGVAPQRDFLMLVQAASDTSPAGIAPNDLLALSRKAVGTGHPSVWSLEPGENAEPKMLHREEEEQWLLSFPVTLQPQSGAPTKKGMALMVAGHAPEA